MRLTRLTRTTTSATSATSFRLTSAALAALLLTSVAGCGSQESDPEETARQVVENVLDNDGEAICDQIAIGGKIPDEEQKKECSDGLGDEIADVEGEDRETMERFLDEGAEDVKEDGDRATVKIDDELSLGFVKIEDTWYWDPIA